MLRQRVRFEYHDIRRRGRKGTWVKVPKSVICYLEQKRDEEPWHSIAIGYAHCHPKDRWDREYGRMLALFRGIEQLTVKSDKSEYLRYYIQRTEGRRTSLSDFTKALRTIYPEVMADVDRSLTSGELQKLRDEGPGIFVGMPNPPFSDPLAGYATEDAPQEPKNAPGAPPAEKVTQTPIPLPEPAVGPAEGQEGRLSVTWLSKEEQAALRAHYEDLALMKKGGAQ